MADPVVGLTSMTSVKPGEQGEPLDVSTQLLLVAQTVISAVLSLLLVRDIRRSRGPGALDELLLLRAVINGICWPVLNVFSLLVDSLRGMLPATWLHPICVLHGLLIVYGIGLVTASNSLLSLCRLLQLTVARRPAVAARLSQRLLAWQNRVAMLLLAGLFSSLFFTNTPPASYFWCTGASELKVLTNMPLTINSAIHLLTFFCSLALLRVSSGPPDTGRPRNYLPAYSWAQLCLVTVIAKTLLVPLNTSNLSLQQRYLGNLALFTVMSGMLDPCLQMLMARRWRQQMRRRRLQIAQLRDTHQRGFVIPAIRLDLI
ncbi:hypothetical protein FJT64_020732 [Amphibalanus amphitrite]|uniref:Uncharacterized protein n=1 Tax=Amphibalanus amphitrite TaxID=1232801 RepID=A0A6A4X0W7_AMPAM|nr:hypothetical protein FJT64_020732 [Amphibalanus amphitrite]